MTRSLALPQGFDLEAHETLGSTMDRARELAAQGASDGTLVWSQEQTAGRGRQGRGWTSPKGNLYLSLLLRPDVAPAKAAEVGFLVALSLAEALESFLPQGQKIACKWPNDLLLDGAKIAGILLESSGGGGTMDWLIVGTGVNLIAHPSDTPYPATNLAMAGIKVAPETLLEAYLARFASRRQRWQAEGFAPIRAAWLARAAGLGGPITARLPLGEVKGTFLDMGSDGTLLLELADGTRRSIAAADILLGH